MSISKESNKRQRKIYDLIEKDRSYMRTYISDGCEKYYRRWLSILNERLTDFRKKNGLEKYSIAHVTCHGWFLDIQFTEYRGYTTRTFANYDIETEQRHTPMTEELHTIVVDWLFELFEDYKKQVELSKKPLDNTILENIAECVNKNVQDDYSAKVECGRFNFERASDEPLNRVIIRSSNGSYVGCIEITKTRVGDLRWTEYSPLSGSSSHYFEVEDIEEDVNYFLNFMGIKK